jgi:TolA-binding protein
MKLVQPLIFVLLAIGLGVWLSREVWVVYAEQRANADEQHRIMRESEDERVRLAKEEARWRNPQGRIERVRSSGYVKPGEVPLEEVR